MNSEKPTANAASSASVAPLKPSAVVSDAPIEVADRAAGRAGKLRPASRHKRIASIADDASSTIAKPIAPSSSG